MKPENLLKALELDKAGDWEGAHALSQSANTPEACWLHAYLHRKEGDTGNAAYWYGRANKPVPECSLDEEWEHLRLAFSQ
ncbi:MAG: hypothetical protein R6V45_05990 [Oceanipulchritudo sp.]